MARRRSSSTSDVLRSGGGLMDGLGSEDDFGGYCSVTRERAGVDPRTQKRTMERQHMAMGWTSGQPHNDRSKLLSPIARDPSRPVPSYLNQFNDIRRTELLDAAWRSPGGPSLAAARAEALRLDGLRRDAERRGSALRGVDPAAQWSRLNGSSARQPPLGSWRRSTRGQLEEAESLVRGPLRATRSREEVGIEDDFFGEYDGRAAAGHRDRLPNGSGRYASRPPSRLELGPDSDDELDGLDTALSDLALSSYAGASRNGGFSALMEEVRPVAKRYSSRQRRPSMTMTSSYTTPPTGRTMELQPMRGSFGRPELPLSPEPTTSTYALAPRVRDRRLSRGSHPSRAAEERLRSYEHAITSGSATTDQVNCILESGKIRVAASGKDGVASPNRPTVSVNVIGVHPVHWNSEVDPLEPGHDISGGENWDGLDDYEGLGQSNADGGRAGSIPGNWNYQGAPDDDVAPSEAAPFDSLGESDVGRAAAARIFDNDPYLMRKYEDLSRPLDFDTLGGVASTPPTQLRGDIDGLHGGLGAYRSSPRGDILEGLEPPPAPAATRHRAPARGDILEGLEPPPAPGHYHEPGLDIPGPPLNGPPLAPQVDSYIAPSLPHIPQPASHSISSHDFTPPLSHPPDHKAHTTFAGFPTVPVLGGEGFGGSIAPPPFPSRPNPRGGPSWGQPMLTGCVHEGGLGALCSHHHDAPGPELAKPFNYKDPKCWDAAGYRPSWRGYIKKK